jgi:hypothetical protein
MVQIGGEHGDSYDQDFCIYNDVFVHEPDGRIRIFGYPEDVFPATDFHSATLLGEFIYVIGSAGPKRTREIGTTPVYKLDIQTFRIQKMETRGEHPGWVSRHRARLISESEIEVYAGKRYDGESYGDFEGRFVLDTQRRIWRRLE